jgi:hypothetical protein
MSTGTDAFEVATEFKFDVGEAMLSSKALQGAVEGVSTAANNALTSLDYLAGGLVAHLGFGSGGLLSILTKAFQTSMAFNDSTLDFANSISSNFNLLQGHIASFNDRLETSASIMGDISSTAIKFGVDPHSLAAITQLVASPLAARQKLGTNYSGGIEMARNMMIASQAVGLPQHAGAEQLAHALSPGQTIGGKLFERMMNTDSFRSAHIIHPQQLANMNQDKKIDLIAKSLEQLGGNADFLAHRLGMIGVQFQILKNEIEVILKPIGDAIIKPLTMMMRTVTTYLGSHGKQIGEEIGQFIGSIIGDPENLYANLRQFSRLKGDFHKAFDFTGIAFSAGAIMGLIPGLKSMGHALEVFLGVKWSIFDIIGSSAGKMTKVLMFLDTYCLKFLTTFGALLFFFQVISRSIALSEIKDAAVLFELFPRILRLFNQLKDTMANIFLPITMATDGLANLIAETSIYVILLEIFVGGMEKLTSCLDFLGVTVVTTMGYIAAYNNMLIGFFTDLSQLKNPMTDMAKNAAEGYTDFITKHPFSNDPAKSVLNQVQNIGKIEARFDMREQLEPDRVAFAVMTHLNDLSTNKRQGSYNSLGSQFGSANVGSPK